MLNYISAELYKLRHKKSLFIGVGLILAMESLLLLPGTSMVLDRDQVGILIGFLAVMMPMGLFLAPIFAALVFDDQHGRATLKNEVVFGVSRGRIYLGKLLAALLAGTAAAAVIIGWYLVVAALLARGRDFLDQEIWSCLWALLLGFWLTWLASAAFTFFLLFTLKTSSGALAAVYLLLVFGLPLCMIGYGEGGAAPERGGFLYWFSKLFFAAPYWDLLIAMPAASLSSPPVLLRALGKAACISLGWVVASSGLGLVIFKRAEIK